MSFVNDGSTGNLLLKGLKKALVMKEKHTAVKAKFDATLSKDLLSAWTRMISLWELDRTKPNPYTYTEKGIAPFPTHVLPHRTNSRLATKVAEVCKQLAEADHQDAQQGCTPHEIPASVFIRSGLEIEDHQ